ncbi:MAG: pseudouridine synthase [Patescibacteria group bacterium]|nr:pseudouridine synthase [Patescibacteria group bacterium]
MPTRLNKFLSQRGYCSRREADRLIEAGKVRINGRVARLGDGVEPKDEVLVEGRAYLEQPELIYILLNKPVGVITTTDETKPDNVIGFIGLSERVFPVGRLDVESTGLLLLTNDGDLADKLTHPRYEHEKEYVVKTAEDISEADLDMLRKGVRLDRKRTLRARVNRIASNRFSISIREGRNRQIRRMCAVIGHRVLALKRVRVHTLKLGRLAVGSWRPLTSEELKSLKVVLKKLKS